MLLVCKAICRSSFSDCLACSNMFAVTEAGALEQAGARQTIFSSEAYLYGRCAFLVTSRTSRVTNENISSIEIGFCMYRKSACVNGLCWPWPSSAMAPASVAYAIKTPPPSFAEFKLEALAGANPIGELPRPLTMFLNSAGLSRQASRKIILVLDPMLLTRSSIFKPAN